MGKSSSGVGYVFLQAGAISAGQEDVSWMLCGVDWGPVVGLWEVTLGSGTVSGRWSRLSFQALLGVGFLRWHADVSEGATVL